MRDLLRARLSGQGRSDSTVGAGEENPLRWGGGVSGRDYQDTPLEPVAVRALQG